MTIYKKAIGLTFWVHICFCISLFFTTRVIWCSVYQHVFPKFICRKCCLCDVDISIRLSACHILVMAAHLPCADPESFVRGGPTLTTFFFLVNEGRDDPNTTINGHHRPASETPFLAFCWRADDGPTLNACLQALWFSGDPGQYC